MMRAFIGLHVPPDVQRSLAELQQDLGGCGADIKWVETQNLHVTLKFLGEITPAQREQIEALLARAAARHPGFSLSVGHLGAFPSAGSPRVIWVALEEGREAVIGLAASVEQEGREVPLRKEERPFAAHVTLGRVRSPRRTQALAERLRAASWRPPRPWNVTAVTLFESVLGSGGPRYSILAELPLGR